MKTPKKLSFKKVSPRTIKIIIVTALIVILLAYFLFFKLTPCKTEECFSQSLVDCKRASFTSETSGNKWFYKIQGSSRDSCTVKVQNLMASKLSTEESSKLVGKSMVCEIPKELQGSYTKIESRIENCHGPLKEGLQDLIIEKLYKYVVQNMGTLTKDAEKLLEQSLE